MKKYFFALMIGIVVLCTSNVYAATPFVCMAMTKKQLFQPTALRCSSLKLTGYGLKLLALSLQGGSLYMACTGAGLPASVLLEGASIGLRSVDLLVGNLPCEDLKSEEELKTLAQKTVCEALKQQGVECDL